MPIYDLRCPDCLHEVRDSVLPFGANPPLCMACGKHMMDKVWYGSAPVRTFKAGFYEHVADTPQYFDSREKLKDFVKRNDMVMDYVDGY